MLGYINFGLISAMAMQTLIIETPVLYDTKFYSYGFRDSDVNHEEQLEFQQLKLE